MKIIERHRYRDKKIFETRKLIRTSPLLSVIEGSSDLESDKVIETKFFIISL